MKTKTKRKLQACCMFVLLTGSSLNMFAQKAEQAEEGTHVASYGGIPEGTAEHSQEAAVGADRRVKAGDFIIFPWGGVPTPDFSGGAWGDMSSPDDLMKDLFDCGYNTTGFIPAGYVPYAAPYRLATILVDHRVSSYPDVTPQQAEETVRAVLNEIESPEMRRNVYSMYIKDEPNASLFPRLNLWAEAIR
ncbi:MAG: hypothetical protein LBJ47_10165, partial [Tannerella sp.]|nr:hypothetical protein [Tannerella sp.]